MRKPFYPFMLSLFIVIDLYSANLNEVSAVEIVKPALMCLAGTMVIFLILRWGLKDWAAVGTATIIFLLIIPYLNHWHSLIPSLILYITGFLLVVYLVRWKAPLKATPYLNLAMLAILLPSLFTIATGAQFVPKTLPRLEPIPLSAGPDIYYIVMDRYSRADILERDFGFDNSEFLDALRSRGFEIADQSYANYAVTPLSLYAALNMEYLPISYYQSVCHSLLKSRVAQSLKESGYTFIQMGAWWDWTGVNPYADINYNRLRPDNFSNMVWKQTFLEIPIQLARGCSFIGNEKWKFQKLAEIAQMDEPTFTFAHFLITHPFYRVNADGSDRPLDTSDEGYLEAIRFSNKCLLEMIDSIPEGIIIIQSDEGHWTEGKSATWSTGQWQQRYGILNAVRGVPIYPTMSHVNTFRQVFNVVFGTELELLPDESWKWTEGKPPVKLSLA